VLESSVSNIFSSVTIESLLRQLVVEVSSLKADVEGLKVGQKAVLQHFNLEDKVHELEEVEWNELNRAYPKCQKLFKSNKIRWGPGDKDVLFSGTYSDTQVHAEPQPAMPHPDIDNLMACFKLISDRKLIIRSLQPGILSISDVDLSKVNLEFLGQIASQFEEAIFIRCRLLDEHVPRLLKGIKEQKVFRIKALVLEGNKIVRDYSNEWLQIDLSDQALMFDKDLGLIKDVSPECIVELRK